MANPLRAFLARAEFMFVLLAIIVFVCWQQHRTAQREEEALMRAVEAARQEDAALREEEARWQAELEAKANATEPREAKQP